jgi:hypothetical protein
MPLSYRKKNFKAIISTEGPCSEIQSTFIGMHLTRTATFDVKKLNFSHTVYL